MLSFIPTPWYRLRRFAQPSLPAYEKLSSLQVFMKSFFATAAACYLLTWVFQIFGSSADADLILPVIIALFIGLFSVYQQKSYKI